MVIQVGSLVTIGICQSHKFLNGRIGKVCEINSKTSIVNISLLDGMIVLINSKYLVLLCVDFERMTITAK
jgi:hypothetical protein